MSLWSLLPRAIRERLVLGRIRARLLEWLTGSGVPRPAAEKVTEAIMDNWQMWAAGIGSIAGGVALIANEIATKAFRMDEIFKGVAAIGAGLTIIGHGKTQAATKAAIEENTRAVTLAGETTARAMRVTVDPEAVVRALNRMADRPVTVTLDKGK